MHEKEIKKNIFSFLTKFNRFTMNDLINCNEKQKKLKNLVCCLNNFYMIYI